MRALRMLSTAALAIAVSFTAASAVAQTVTKPGETIKASATIQTIDFTNRLIGYRTEKGEDAVVYAPPAIARFNELKVGDKINLTYYESTVYQVRKPGDPAPKPSDGVAVTSGSGKLPAGTIGRQATSSVTVKAVDPNVPSITVLTADGRTISRKVEQKSYLTGVKVGDKIDITYTEAVLAQIERAPAK